MEARLRRVALDFLTDNRGIFVCLVLLPLSVLLNCFNWLSMRWRLYRCDPEQHARRVEQISRDIKELARRGDGDICTDRPGWQNMSLKTGEHKENKPKINLRLTDILALDVANKTVTVEPLVNMGQLTEYLLPRSLTLPVVPELDELTVGGLIMGFGIESSSHIYGLFQEIVTELELVLADGTVVVATATNEHRELFYAVPWSHGSIALLVSCKLRVVPCTKYITLRYRRFNDLDALCGAVRDASTGAAAAQFVEALQYNLHNGVLMQGRLTDEIPAGSAYNDISLWWKQWFYVHVDELTARLPAASGAANDAFVEETMPLRAYYHRHTRAIFWEMTHIISWANAPWFRYLLGWSTPPNIPLLKASQTEAVRKMWRREFCVQDMLVPVSSLAECLRFCDKRLQLYPVWLCPHLVVRHPLGGMLKPSRFAPADAASEVFIDVGLYGVPARQPYEHITCMRALEQWVRDHDGYQGLYAVSYMSREEFRVMFDHALYDKCRARYGAKGRFPDVYDKIASPAALEA